jgi:hypothetical protein
VSGIRVFLDRILGGRYGTTSCPSEARSIALGEVSRFRVPGSPLALVVSLTPETTPSTSDGSLAPSRRSTSRGLGLREALIPTYISTAVTAVIGAARVRPQRDSPRQLSPRTSAPCGPGVSRVGKPKKDCKTTGTTGATRFYAVRKGGDTHSRTAVCITPFARDSGSRRGRGPTLNSSSYLSGIPRDHGRDHTGTTGTTSPLFVVVFGGAFDGAPFDGHHPPLLSSYPQLLLEPLPVPGGVQPAAVPPGAQDRIGVVVLILE